MEAAQHYQQLWRTRPQDPDIAAFEQVMRSCTERFLNNVIAQYLGMTDQVTPIDWTEFDAAAQRLANTHGIGLSLKRESDKMKFLIEVLSATFAERNR